MKTFKFLIAPFVVLAGYLCVFLVFRQGREAFLRVHFPLEMIILASALWCAVNVGRLWSERSTKQLAVRISLIANGFVIGLFLVACLGGLFVVLFLR